MQSNVQILPFGEAQLEEVYAVFRDAIPECWSVEALREELHHPMARILVAIQNRVVLGFVQARHIAGEGDLLNIAVSAAARRQGIGRILIQALLELAQKEKIAHYILEVREQNTPAIAFYESLGMIRVGRRRDFYRAPTDHALLYQLDVAPETEFGAT